MKANATNAMLTPKEIKGLVKKSTGGGGLFSTGQEGVNAIYATACEKLEFIEFSSKTLGYVPSVMDYPAFYPLLPAEYKGNPKAVLMDLDGTSVHSEEFWMYIIARTMGELLGDQAFSLEEEDIPFVSGHSVSEHLQYCIDKYAPEKTVEAARDTYHTVTAFEMEEIVQGRGKQGAFKPAPYLKEFLTALKEENIKIGLVTSGLYNKAIPEIISAFRELNMGDPLEFYDAIITAGQAIIKGQPGTIGELAPKPHPWLYAETARIGLGIESHEKPHVIGIEDSAAGIYSLRLAGFASIGVAGGNILQSGAESLCNYFTPDLKEALDIILP